MHIDKNGRLLRTKIVATVGAERGGTLRVHNPDGPPTGREDEICDPGGAPVKNRIKIGTLLEWFIRAGVDVIRLNMSFASSQQAYGSSERKVLQWLNKNREGFAKHVAVLGDLPGPKVRLRMHNEQPVKRGDAFFLDFREQNRIAPPQRGASVLVYEEPFERKCKVKGHHSISAYLRHAKRISRDVVFYVGDGQVTLQAEREKDGVVTCRVSKGGIIRKNKGLTIRHEVLDMPSFMKPDKDALNFLIDYGAEVVGFIAVSFVRTKEDVLDVKHHVEERLRKRWRHLKHDEIRRCAPAIIAKIETADANENIDSILDVADGVMVARGDLGLQFDPEEVPAIQRQLIQLCNIRGKPVITATQMLESMTENMEPTRAEATDVFNAILGGTDAIMLSGETSTGRYPVQAIEMMVKIGEKAEDYYFKHAPPKRFEDIMEEFGKAIDQTTSRLGTAAQKANTNAQNPKYKSDRQRYEWMRDLYGEKQLRSEKQETTDRVSQAACSLSLRKEGADKAIIAPTTSGRTARMISRFRPSVPIIGAAHDIYNARKLLLSFGVYPLDIGRKKKDNIDQIFDRTCEEAMRVGYLEWEPDFTLLSPGDNVISTSGTPLHEPGTTNLIQIREVGKTRTAPRKQRKA